MRTLRIAFEAMPIIDLSQFDEKIIFEWRKGFRSKSPMIAERLGIDLLFVQYRLLELEDIVRIGHPDWLSYKRMYLQNVNEYRRKHNGMPPRPN